jgi:hypothetical protein
MHAILGAWSQRAVSNNAAPRASCLVVHTRTVVGKLALMQLRREDRGVLGLRGGFGAL